MTLKTLIDAGALIYLLWLYWFIRAIMPEPQDHLTQLHELLLLALNREN